MPLSGIHDFNLSQIGFQIRIVSGMTIYNCIIVLRYLTLTIP